MNQREEDQNSGKGVMRMVEEAVRRGDISPELAENARWNTLADAQDLDVFDSFCSIMDLGGFGNGLRASNWDLEKAQQQGLIQDLAYFFTMGARSIPSPTSEERILVLNDAIARTVDPAHGIDMLAMTMYVRDLVTTHCQILYNLRSRDLGIRTVLAGGQRIQYAPHAEPKRASDRVFGDDPDRIFRVEGNTVVYNPYHFQMNTAFSRAFLIESAGHDEGIHHNRIYIDAHWIDVWKGLFGRDPVQRNSSNTGILKFQLDGFSWLDLEYDAIVTPSIPKIGQPIEVFQLSHMREYKSLAGDKSSMPLLPDGVIQEFDARKASGWSRRPS